MSRSFESARWNACVHKLDLGLYSYPKEFLGNRVRTCLSPRKKKPATGGSGGMGGGGGRTRDAASRRTASPKHYRLSYSSQTKRLYAKLTDLYSNVRTHSPTTLGR